jgi:hypothetical protein
MKLSKNIVFEFEKVKNVKHVSMRISKDDYDFLVKIGNGSKSQGFRKAIKMARKLMELLRFI